MKKLIIITLTTLAAAVIAVGGAYIARDYWAVGGEWLVPFAVAALLTLREEEGETNE